MLLQTKLRNIIGNRDYKSLKIFLDEFKNVNLNYVHPNASTTIMVALLYNNEECIKLLVDRGMNVDQPCVYIDTMEEFNGMSPLLVEAKFGCIEKVKFLLKIGASLYFRTESGKNILNVTTNKKLKKILYKHVKSIDYYIIKNIIDFLYPKI